MNEIIRHIEFLLIANDCVVIPALGAVIAHDVPAYFNRDQHIFMPPSRTFSFNTSLDHNDGLLISSIARSRSISFEAAKAIVAREVDAMKRTLSERHNLLLGAIGVLTVNDSGMLTFSPGRMSSSLSHRFFGLSDIQCQPIAELARRRALKEDYAEIKRHSPVNYFHRVLRVAASFALLLALGFVLTTPINFEKAQYASLGIENFSISEDSKSPATSQLIRRPGESTGVVKFSLRSFDDACETVDTAERAAYVRQRHSEIQVETVQTSESAGDDLRLNENDRYFLIIASLTTERDAQEFIENSNNRQLGILAKDGRYRVYAATGVTLRQAQSAASSLSGRYPDVWVFRK